MIKKIIFLILFVLFLDVNAVYAGTYTCSDITSGTPTSSQTQICNSGTLQDGSAGELCPFSQTTCTQQTSTPSCPSGYSLSNNTCTSTVSATCLSGYTWNGSTCSETTTQTTAGSLSASGEITSNGKLASTLTVSNNSGGYTLTWTENNGPTTSEYCYLSYSGGEQCNTYNSYYPGCSGSYGGSINYYSQSNSFSGSFTFTGSTNSGWLFVGTVSGGNNSLNSTSGGNLNSGCTQQYSSPSTITYNSASNIFSGQWNIGGNASWSSISGSGNCIVGDGGTYGLSGSICVTDTCPSGYTYSNGTCTETVTQTASPACPSGYTLSGDTCTATTSATCPSGTTLVNNECVSPWTCPVSGNGGDSATCIEPSGSSTYYCSPYSCYTDSSGTTVSTTPVSATMPPSQTNNGTVTSNGCNGSVYLFPGTAMQCRSGGEQTAWQDCCNASSYLFGQIKCTTQEESVAKDLQYDTQYGANGYSNSNSYGGSGDAQYVGSYCSDKFLGLCLENMKVYCVFHSLLGLIIQEQGRTQLGIGFGSPQNPDCSGLTPTQFQELNFSNFDFTEYVTVLENKIKAGVINTNTLNQMQNYTNTITNQISNYENELSGVNP